MSHRSLSKKTTPEPELETDIETLPQENYQPNILKRFLIIFLILFVVLPATLALVVIGFLTNKPQDLLKIQRDNTRISDLDRLNQLIKTTLQTSTKPDILCGSTRPPCIGFSFTPTAPSINGQGWIKIDFSQNSQFSSTRLPLDPINNLKYYYRYCSDGKDWEINTNLESVSNTSKMETDGGDDPNLYEIGSNLTLCPK